ncbi:sulfatase-modifying factor protein [Candidatus Megaera polyxenophila]|nr:sulfatase-modifying factor protein [Candidatus Megaera polyxenophila]
MKKINSLYPLNNYNCSKNELLEYFKNSWQLSEILYSTIQDEESLYLNPDKSRLPLLFYLGHTAAFYINKMRITGLIQKGVNDSYEKLFAEGVDPAHPQYLRVVNKWPSYEEVRQYRAKVFEIVINVIENLNFDFIHQESKEYALLMSIEHDRIHFETSSVLIRQYCTDVLKKPKHWIYAPITNEQINQSMITVPNGYIVIGKPKGHPYFAWDNENGYLNVQVEAFVASRNLVSNKEFLNFVNNEGYYNSFFWSTEGWSWKIENKATHPRFWRFENDIYKYRTVFEEINIPWNWPVEVNFYEAEAYCNWLGNGTRLMKEEEFELMSQYSDVNREPFLQDNYNINMKFGSPCAVNFFESNSSCFNDVYGNVFQWLKTQFYPLPGFQTHNLYPHFSYPFFTPDHMMLKGGSWASTGTSASRYYRLWFRKHIYQHAGFRVVQDL